MTLNKRQVVFLSNMFDPTQKVITEVDDSLSFREIYRSLTHYPDEYAVIIDDARKITDLDLIPESRNIAIRLFPSGGGGGWIGGVIDSVTDFVGDVAGQYNSWQDFAGLVSFGWIGAFYSITWNAFQVGTEMFMNYLADKYGQDYDSSDRSTRNRPNLRGGGNRPRQGGRVGVLLGKHLINPDVAGMPYISLDNGGKDQYLHVMYCGGYSNIQIDAESYKIGDTKLTQANFDNHGFEVTQDGSQLSLYPERIISKSVGTLLTSKDLTGVIKTTPTNTKRIDIFITFPQGLVKFSQGNKENATVHISIEYRSVGGEWRHIMNAPVTDNTSETKRIRYTTLNLDNNNPGGADYNVNRQYEIRVRRVTADSTENTVVDKVYLDTIQCATASFAGGSFNSSPVLASEAAKLTLFALKIKATETVNGQIESFNFIAQSRVPVYSGSGTGASRWTAVSPSSNPAALFLYCVRISNINKRPAGENKINWASFEAWFLFCNTKGLECNAYVTNETPLETILNSIASAGRASWSIVDGRYSVIIDREQAVSVQFFTPRNSWGFAASKSFEEHPTGLRISFIDRDSGYNSTELVVHLDDISSDKIDDYSLFGCTFYANVYKQAKYMLACMHLRRETFSFNADIEHIICTRWDRISIAHDVLLVGLHTGRIKNLLAVAGNIAGIETDERVIFEPGKNYGVTIRDSAGLARSYAIVNPASVVNIETDEIELMNPFPVVGSPIKKDDLFMFGLYGMETLNLIVTGVEPTDELTAKITCVPYVPELYTWDGGTPPVYDPRISQPGDVSGAAVTGIPIDPGLLGVENTGKIGETDNINTALTAIYDTIEIISTSAYKPLFPFFDNVRKSLIYYNASTGTIFEKSISSIGGGSQLINQAGYVFCNNYYVRSSDGYVYDFNDVLIIDVTSWCPQVDEYGRILYIDLRDGGLYSHNIANSMRRRVGSFTLKHLWINYLNNNQALIWDDGSINGTGVKSLIVIDTETGAFIRTIREIDEPQSFQQFDANIYLSHTADFDLYKITSDSMLYIPDIVHYDALDGCVFYLNRADEILYKQYKDIESAKLTSRPYFRTTQQIITITGNIAAGSNIVSAVSDSDLKLVEINNVLDASGIPVNSYIETIDKTNNRLILSKKAGATTTGLLITVVTSRLMLDAESAVLAGTINSRHLASAVVSTEKLMNGAITNQKIADNAITLSKMADASVGSAEIIDSSVINSKIADGAITASKLGGGSVTSAKIANQSILSGMINTNCTVYKETTFTAASVDHWFPESNGMYLVVCNANRNGADGLSYIAFVKVYQSTNGYTAQATAVIQNTGGFGLSSENAPAGQAGIYYSGASATVTINVMKIYNNK